VADVLDAFEDRELLMHTLEEVYPKRKVLETSIYEFQHHVSTLPICSSIRRALARVS
jgi:hypothetical protein